MNIYIPCAGRGERLWPLSQLIPKCLWPIGGKPCVRWIVERLSVLEATTILCILSKDVQLFTHEFRDTKVFYADWANSEGTAGQLLRAFQGWPPDKTILVHYADCIVNVDYVSLVEAHLKADAAATLVVTNNVKSPYGKVVAPEVITNTLGGTGSTQLFDIQGFEEKPLLQNYTWTGVAVLKGSELERVIFPNTDFGYDIFPVLTRAGAKMQAFIVPGPYYDIGSIESYNLVNELASRGQLFG